jgi:3-ketosteroid 9alpha-monooxygenase subunit A
MAKTQDYKLGEFTFPRGWFVVAESSQIGSTPHSDRFFAEDVVLFRGASGKVIMLDAYCPHMGTHMGKNKTSHSVVNGHHVEADSIRCPYHGWRFGADGRCNEIPFYDGPIPEKARVRSWPVVERYGIVFCWHDPEEQAPDVELPEYPEWEDPQWVRWQVDRLGVLPTHPQEVADNTSDIRHLTFLHGSAVRWYENEVDGHILHQRQGGQAISSDAHAGLTKFSTLVRYVGPALLSSRFYMNDSEDPGIAQLIAHTPVDDGTTRLWHASMMKSLRPVIDDEARAAARQMNETLRRGFMEDFEIWTNKRPALQILQVPTDGPFGRSRIWYSQFYNPRAKAPQLVARVTGVHKVKGCPSMAEFSGQQVVG